MTSFHRYVASLKADGTSAICDLGCGPNKYPGAYGVDSFAFDGVDKIVNLDEAKWDLADQSFDLIVAHQVLEHVEDPIVFFKNIHRIAKPGALVVLAVPHFTSASSYRDPTHKRHLSALWHQTLTSDNYLKQIVGGFELVDNRLTFGRGFKDKLAKLYIRLYGLEKYERRVAFKMPGIDVYTALRVVKS